MQYLIHWHTSQTGSLRFKCNTLLHKRAALRCVLCTEPLRLLANNDMELDHSYFTYTETLELTTIHHEYTT